MSSSRAFQLVNITQLCWITLARQAMQAVSNAVTKHFASTHSAMEGIFGMRQPRTIPLIAVSRHTLALVSQEIAPLPFD